MIYFTNIKCASDHRIPIIHAVHFKSLHHKLYNVHVFRENKDPIDNGVLCIIAYSL